MRIKCYPPPPAIAIPFHCMPAQWLNIELQIKRTEKTSRKQEINRITENAIYPAGK